MKRINNARNNEKNEGGVISSSLFLKVEIYQKKRLIIKKFNRILNKIKLYIYLMKETDLVDIYIEIRNNEESNHIIVREKGYRQKKLDIIEINFNSKYLFHGIEFKINNWKLGLEQCLGNRILVPYNSLALYYKFEKNVNIEEFVKYGIGLIIIYDDDYVQKILPKKNNLLNYSKYHYIYEKIRNIYPETPVNCLTPYS